MDNLLLQAQHATAEAMAAFHAQLRACFSGDIVAVRASHQKAADETAKAILLARQMLGERFEYDDEE